MKLKIIMLIIIISILVTGCSPKEEVDLMEKGQLALEKHEYKEAREIFSEILEEDESNQNARTMYMQARRMQKSIEYEDAKNYEKAIKELSLIEGIKDGLSSIKKEATDKKKELIKLNEEYQKAQEQRKQNAKEVASKDRYRVEQQVLKEQQRIIQQQLAQQKKQEENEQQEVQELPTISQPPTEELPTLEQPKLDDKINTYIAVLQ